MEEPPEDIQSITPPEVILTLEERTILLRITENSRFNPSASWEENLQLGDFELLNVNRNELVDKIRLANETPYMQWLGNQLLEERRTRGELNDLLNDSNF